MDPRAGTLFSTMFGRRSAWRARVGTVVRERHLTTVALAVAALAALLAAVVLAP